MITSSSCLEIQTRRQLVWSVTGQKAVVSSTTQPKHSLSGSMKRINLESFPCKRVEMSGVYSKDWPEVSRPYKTQSRLNRQRLPIVREVRLYPLLPNQSWHWHESFRPRRPPRMDQGQHRCPCGKKILYSKRNTECNYFPSYCDLNLFQKDI